MSKSKHDHLQFNPPWCTSISNMWKDIHLLVWEDLGK